MNRYTAGLVLAWTLLVAASVLWNLHLSHLENRDKALIQARTLYELNLIYRRWSSNHGGVYVPVTDRLRPNPYLNVADRDVVTTKGKQLTLVNPAWMTRQVFDLINEEAKLPFLSHLTSLKNVNPANRPDAWEERGLLAFEGGAREINEEVEINGRMYLRVLKPFVTEEGCIKCHGSQGYRVGDVRGGMSIAVPMEPYLQAEALQVRTIVASHFLFWVIGGVGIVLYSRATKRQQEAVAESEQKYRLLFESNPHPMWVYDLETLRFLTVNDAAVRHYGYAREEFLSLTIKDIRPPEDVPRLLANVAGVTEGIDDAGVWRHLKKDGSVIHVEITSHTVAFAGRRAEIVLAHDVTERVRAEHALAAEKNRAQLYFDVAGVILLVIDAGQRVTRVNRKGCQVLGYAEEDILGKNWFDHFLPAAMRDPMKSVFARIVAGELESFEYYENPVVTRDGDERMIAWHNTLLRDAAGRVVAALSSGEDVTERSILEEQLRQAQKMEAVGQLAGGVAHDFNNILTAIMGYGSLLRMNMGDDDGLRSHVDQILTSAERAASLTQGLLAFSRKHVIDPKPVDVNGVIRRVEKLLARLIGEDIELTIDLADEALTVMADQSQLEQVLMNLATNARDAMPDGGRLTVRSARVVLDEEFMRRHQYSPSGPCAVVCVADTGQGMEDRTAKRVFEPFFTTKEQGKGTGLGLSIAYGIITQHQGHITVASEPGQGTEFRFYLPLVGAAAEEDERPEPAALPGGTETILVAEDSEAVRSFITLLLRGAGYSVISAENGEEALQKFQENSDRVRLLLLDVIMPRKNGKEVYAEVRKTAPGLRALFMSGYTADIVHRKGILEEGLHYVAKPVSPRDLLRKVREVLDGPV
jgi:PAS domain S-box-containing protein